MQMGQGYGSQMPQNYYSQAQPSSYAFPQYNTYSQGGSGNYGGYGGGYQQQGSFAPTGYGQAGKYGGGYGAAGGYQHAGYGLDKKDQQVRYSLLYQWAFQSTVQYDILIVFLTACLQAQENQLNARLLCFAKPCTLPCIGVFFPHISTSETQRGPLKHSINSKDSDLMCWISGYWCIKELIVESGLAKGFKLFILLSWFRSEFHVLNLLIAISFL